MKLISLEEIREVVANERPDIYYIPEGRVLSPAAKDFLNEQCIRFDNANRKALNEKRNESLRYLNHNYTSRNGSSAAGGNHGNLAHDPFRKALNTQGKPEPMTYVYGTDLVMKDDPIIQYRGKLDSAQSQLVFVESILASEGENRMLLSDLEDILSSMRELMRAEVLHEPIRKTQILGLTSEELRAQSHHPEETFGVPAMQLPSYTMGTAYAGLNMLRATIREAEVLAVHAFKQGNRVSRPDLIEQLNRLSSAFHILMCRYEAGYYER